MVSLVAGLALTAVTLVLGLAMKNRHVRGRLVGSAFGFAAFAAIAAIRSGIRLDPSLDAALERLGWLVAAFGTVNAVVALAINPWRTDTLPDRFPTIVQDSIVIVLLGLAATLVLRERILAASAIGAVVIGLALQDTLGNFFAGLAIQIEKPFRVGHWVRVNGMDAMVTQLTWRATKLRTKTGNFVIVPNSVLSRDTIVNYSEPTLETRIEVEVGASYDVPPNEVKAAILAAVRNEPLLLASREPEVLLVDFAASAITYRVRAWTVQFTADDQIRDRLRTAIYYALRRHRIDIPYPIQVQIPGELAPPAPADPALVEEALAGVPLFAALNVEERAQLAHSARRSLFGAGETVVKQGDAGSSLFIVANGEVAVTLEPGNRELARIGPGGMFGEMSLLTGERRSATVRTACDADLIEIAVEPFRRFVLANPHAAHVIGEAAAVRQAELQGARATANLAVLEPPHRFLSRVRRFLRLEDTPDPGVG